MRIRDIIVITTKMLKYQRKFNRMLYERFIKNGVSYSEKKQSSKYLTARLNYIKHLNLDFFGLNKIHAIIITQINHSIKT